MATITMDMVIWARCTLMQRQITMPTSSGGFVTMLEDIMVTMEENSAAKLTIWLIHFVIFDMQMILLCSCLKNDLQALTSSC